MLLMMLMCFYDRLSSGRREKITRFFPAPVKQNTLNAASTRFFLLIDQYTVLSLRFVPEVFQIGGIVTPVRTYLHPELQIYMCIKELLYVGSCFRSDRLKH